jgi:hypothetical protein
MGHPVLWREGAIGLVVWSPSGSLRQAQGRLFDYAAHAVSSFAQDDKLRWRIPGPSSVVRYREQYPTLSLRERVGHPVWWDGFLESDHGLSDAGVGVGDVEAVFFDIVQALVRV